MGPLASSLRPVIVSSVRDVLVEKGRAERDAEMVEAARAAFDAVLVHGDPEFIPFDRTFPMATKINDLIHYTGYCDHGLPRNSKLPVLVLNPPDSYFSTSGS